MDNQDHGTLALWTADCAEHVLSRFEVGYPEDHRPRKAIQACRAWARAEVKMSEARAAAIAAHAAARDADQSAARAAARAAGHAAATAHMAAHATHAAAYAIKAVALATDSAAAIAEERAWQYQRIPEHLLPVALPTPGDN